MSWNIGYEFELPSGNRASLKPVDVGMLLRKRSELPGVLMEMIEKLIKGERVPDTDEELDAEAAEKAIKQDRLLLLEQNRAYGELVASLMMVKPRVGDETNLELGVVAAEDIPLEDLNFMIALMYKPAKVLRFLAAQPQDSLESVLQRDDLEQAAEQHYRSLQNSPVLNGHG